MLDIISYSILFVIFIMIIVCIFKVKDFFSRIICLNSISNLVALFIANLGTYEGRESYLDVALIYMLLSYVFTIALLRINRRV